MLLNNDFKEFFELLNAHNVHYLIVGGYAVGFHGYPRYTQDIDIFYDRSTANAKALWSALQAFGFGNIGLAQEDFIKDTQVVQLGQPPNRIDLINTIDAVSFETAWNTRVSGEYGDIPVAFIGKAELLHNKTATGRDKDLVDAKALSQNSTPADAEETQ